MPNLLHAADLHLDSPQTGLEAYEGAPVDEIRGATRRALEHLVELALDEAVDALLLAGDIYDGDWRDYNTGLFFAGQMTRLKEARIPVFMVQGNHDAASQISRQLRLPDNVHLFPSRRPGSIRLESAGLALHGQSYPSRQVEQNLARGYPPAEPGAFNIGLLHTSLDGRPGHASYAPCRLDDLRRLGYDYWALGHVHQREVVSQDPWVVFPGNLQGRHARETGVKGATLVRIDKGQVQAVEHHPLDAMRWALCEIAVDDGIKREQLEERIASALRTELDAADGRLLAIRLRLHGSTREDAELRARAEELLNQCRLLALDSGGRGIWIEKLVIATERPRVIASATHVNTPDEASPSPPSPISPSSPLGEALADPESLLNASLDDPTSLTTALLEEVADLERKLPASLTSESDPLDLSPASLTRQDGDLHQCLRDAHALLLERLGDPPTANPR
ncbi:putative metallophosphoesterase YhaO [Thiorhodovibrio winogradskyi]|uniref:Metallophosphoesterase YhaO n=1 Tax=Thiorhodovibrio winogradskyi TaxID=77007 RepID=A0ABZ0S499_9GAMM|nr:DNA repair exonuclease [Thiorhodovibrio winogradskyi]